MLQKLMKKQANVLIVIIIIIGIIVFWLSLKKPTPPTRVKEKPTQKIEEISGPLKSGEVGEIPEEEAKEKNISPLPPTIFNTSGIIQEIKEDRLIIKGDGSNFEDREPRELNLIFNDSTITSDSNRKITYQGLEGLKYLKPGMKVSIEGTENIRGKIEFKVSSISILY
ncbi:MAG: hypothetical protein COS76_02305 [Candidatus Portnoybacteria bacterium CG06_land_8_20_14_3_00_39_12]|uniref:DUF5666 domain-containing protein n=1 Tax=Candidatus Portnoybacteria bacterium CG06_land_8_20_14_3_00_39_12 TaxID=1974809 RepID=A0A2M7AWY9_9BACT|nr:MAG: hypothetical protein COS76_02305 [Candidatus Portnoybacteria bacterium CG06_land_8_20_14_3_00_39_12]